jgi:hypothetical protein
MGSAGRPAQRPSGAAIAHDDGGPAAVLPSQATHRLAAHAERRPSCKGMGHGTDARLEARVKTRAGDRTERGRPLAGPRFAAGRRAGTGDAPSHPPSRADDDAGRRYTGLLMEPDRASSVTRTGKHAGRRTSLPMAPWGAVGPPRRDCARRFGAPTAITPEAGTGPESRPIGPSGAVRGCSRWAAPSGCCRAWAILRQERSPAVGRGMFPPRHPPTAQADGIVGGAIFGAALSWRTGRTGTTSAGPGIAGLAASFTAGRCVCVRGTLPVPLRRQGVPAGSDP